MGPLAAQQKPKLWQLNYFADKAELEALGPKRPLVAVGGRVGRPRYTHGETGKHGNRKRGLKNLSKKNNFSLVLSLFEKRKLESPKTKYTWT